MDEWLSYKDAGERLGISAEAVRQRAIRGHWPRQRGNDGTALVRIPEGVTVRLRTPVEQVDEQASPSGREHPTERLVAALEAHIETLRTDLALARAETESVRTELAAERDAAREATAAYRRLTDELIELRKAAAASPPSRRSAPRPRPAPEPSSTGMADARSGFIQREDFDVEGGMEAIRKRLEARLAARGH